MELDLSLVHAGRMQAPGPPGGKRGIAGGHRRRDVGAGERSTTQDERIAIEPIGRTIAGYSAA